MKGVRSIAVLGGGITGLTAAYRLGELGHRVRLFEQSSRLGGAIRTEIAHGWLSEGGPNSFQIDEEIRELLHELALDDELVEPSPLAKNRYIARGEALVCAPLSPGTFLASPLFSWGTKLRVVRDFFRRPRTEPADLSIAEFTRRHFGAEALDRLVQPFVSGIYAGDPAALSTRYGFPKLWAMAESHGSVLRGQIAAAKTRRTKNGGANAPTIVSFRRGLQTLPHTLAAKMPGGVFALNAHVEKLISGTSWQVHWLEGAQARAETFDAVVATLPAEGLSGLVIGGNGERPLASLAEIPHPPVSSLFLGFKREDVAHPLDGFGVLVPASERRSILGVIFSSSLFPDRAPPGHVALTVLVGGMLQPQLARLPSAQLIATALPDLRALLGVSGEPVFQRHTFWPKAIPQYQLGYERYLAAISATEHAHPGLFIGGQARDGIALSSCLAVGEKLAQRATQ